MCRVFFLICITHVLAGCSLDWGDKSSEKARCQGEECGDAGRDQPDGDVPGGCFADEDGDSHGDPARPRPCSTDPVSMLSDDCDDSDARAFPKAPEVCDGIDNDCDDTADEELEVVPYYPDADMDGYGVQALEELRCAMPDGYVSTSGDCNDTTADVSPLGTETCNFRDDDCDGVVDPGLAIKTDAQIFTQAGIASAVLGQVSLLAKEGGGAWLLYRMAESGAGTNGMLVAAELGRNGRFVRKPAIPVRSDMTSLWEGTSWWTADSDGRWVVILKREVGTNTLRLSLQLHRATDLAFVGELSLEAVANNLAVLPIAVSVFEDALGNVQVLSAYSKSETTGVGEEIVGKTYYRVSTRSAQGQFLPGTAKEILFGEQSGSITASSLALGRVPCREEWMLAYAISSFREVRRVDVRGVMAEQPADTLADSTGVVGMFGGEARCGLGDAEPELMVIYRVSDISARIRIWNVDRETGALTQAASDFDRPAAFAPSARQIGGRWFLGAGDVNERAVLVELRPNASGAERIRTLALTDAGGPDAGRFALGNDLSFAHFPSRSGLIDTGSSVVFAVPNGWKDSNLDSLRASYVPAGSDAAANVSAAVTYQIGCP